MSIQMNDWSLNWHLLSKLTTSILNLPKALCFVSYTKNNVTACGYIYECTPNNAIALI